MMKHIVKFGIGESGTKVQRTQYSVGKRLVNVLRKELDTKSYKVGGHKVSAAMTGLRCRRAEVAMVTCK